MDSRCTSRGYAFPSSGRVPESVVPIYQPREELRVPSRGASPSRSSCDVVDLSATSEQMTLRSTRLKEEIANLRKEMAQLCTTTDNISMRPAQLREEVASLQKEMVQLCTTTDQMTARSVQLKEQVANLQREMIQFSTTADPVPNCPTMIEGQVAKLQKEIDVLAQLDNVTQGIGTLEVDMSNPSVAAAPPPGEAGALSMREAKLAMQSYFDSQTQDTDLLSLITPVETPIAAASAQDVLAVTPALEVSPSLPSASTIQNVSDSIDAVDVHRLPIGDESPHSDDDQRSAVASRMTTAELWEDDTIGKKQKQVANALLAKVAQNVGAGNRALGARQPYLP